MRVTHFPWSPALAGFGAGVVGFVAAALAAGTIHLGPADSCWVHDHRRDGDGDIRAAAVARDVDDHLRCPCCCDARLPVTVAGPDGADLELAAIARPAAWGGCEDDAGPLAPAPDALALWPDSDRPEMPFAPLIDLTTAVATEDAEAVPAPAQRPVAGDAARGWLQKLANPDTPAPTLAGLPGVGPFGAGGGSGAAPAVSRLEPGRAATAAGLDLPADLRPAALAGAELSRLVAAPPGAATGVLDNSLAIFAPPGTPDASSITLTEPGATPAATTVKPAATVAVPEPAALVLAIVSLGLGLAGAAGRRCRPGAA